MPERRPKLILQLEVFLHHGHVAYEVQEACAMYGDERTVAPGRGTAGHRSHTRALVQERGLWLCP